MIICSIVSDPRLFFVTYLTLVHTFLITTHLPVSTYERHGYADVYIEVICALLFHSFLKVRPDMYDALRLITQNCQAL
jgi:hypothetical protein